MSDLEYSYDGGKTFVKTDNIEADDEKDLSVMKVQVRTSDKKYLINLEDIDFYWNAPKFQAS